MNLLKVQSLSKTYGQGETAVHALKQLLQIPFVRLPVVQQHREDDVLLHGQLRDQVEALEETILMITHSQSIAQTADRVLQVSDGVLTDLGGCRGGKFPSSTPFIS